MKKQFIRSVLTHITIIIAMMVICCLYFYPQLEGKRTQQGDIVQSRSMSGELTEFYKKTGETYYWNNGMFAGMPWGLLTYGSNQNLTKKVHNFFQLFFKRPIGYFLGAMICAYLGLVLLGVSPILAAIGAIGFSLSTGLLILWEAGHATKLLVISFMPLILTGVILILGRKKYFLGAALMALGISLTIAFNHIQMVYYLALMLSLLVLVFYVFELKEKQFGHVVKSTTALLIAAALGAMSNSSQLLSSRSYAEDTMRGAPILENKSESISTSEAQSSSEVEGLEWNYAMSWSSGFQDLLAFLIPAAAGGSSAEEVSANSAAGRLLRQNNARQGSDGTFQAPMYWGGLPFTAGPNYMGASLLTLFFLGIIFVDNRLKYGVLALLFFGVLLSMGDNASWLNKPLFEHLPLFNKFRAPNSLSCILPLFFSLVAIIGVDRMFSPKRGSSQKVDQKKIILTGALLGGFCLVLALMGASFFDFSSQGDGRYQESVSSIFIETRKAIFQQDAWRSLFFILATLGLIFSHVKGYLKQRNIVFFGLGVLVLLDLWGVGRRYLDEDNFVEPGNYETNFAERPVDKQIKQLEPKGRGYYRVFDLSINTFNSASTSYHHNTVGGYHPAKLQRYQDMIDYYISKGHRPVLNMLNAKYFITQQGQLQTNPDALGSAWFVDTVLFVQTPNEEIERVGNIDPSSEAVLLSKDFDFDESNNSFKTTGSSITLSEYRPNRLVYKVDALEDQLAVFSEVWYGPDKGWKVTIDGQEVSMIRVNYLLRALAVPAGTQHIVFEFKPVKNGALGYITLLSSFFILIGLLGVLGWETNKWYEKEKFQPAETTKTEAIYNKSKHKSDSTPDKKTNKSKKKRAKRKE